MNHIEGDQRIILVAAKFRKEVTSTVLWLRNYHGVDITCIKVTPYVDDDKLFLDTEQIIPIQDIGDYQVRLTAKKQEETASSKKEAARHKKRYAFWKIALPVLKEKAGVFNNVSPTKDNWISGASGYSGISFNPIIKMDGARVEIYIDNGDEAKNLQIFNTIKDQEPVINKMLAEKIDWQDLPGKRACKICLEYNEYGLDDEEQWDEIIEWMASNMASLIKTFKPMIDNAMLK